MSELARIKGIRKQSVAERLTRLVDQGLIKVELRGRQKLVSLAEWDSVTNEVTDPAKLAARDTKREIAGQSALASDQAARMGGAENDPTYTDELKRKAGFEADLKEIEVRRQRGELLEVDDVRRSMERCAEDLVRSISHVSSYKDDVAAAMASSGVSGVGAVLKKIERELRERLARSMRLRLGESSAEGDPE